MKAVKKFALIFLGIALIFTLWGCSNPDFSPENAVNSSVEGVRYVVDQPKH